MTTAQELCETGTSAPIKRTGTRSTCIQEVFSSVAGRHPNALAALFGEEQLTYGELDGLSNQLAHSLQEHGVGPEVVVGIAVDRARSLDMLISFWGCSRRVERFCC